MQIIEYNPKYKEQFIEFNKNWIIDNFGYLEENDLKTFENIENSLKSGSMIYMAAADDILPAGCMAKKDSSDEWEICKLCSNKHIEHKGAGTKVFKACFDYALKNGAKRIYIISENL